MLGVEQVQDLCIAMARNTGIRASTAVAYFLTEGRLTAHEYKSSKINRLRKQSHQNRPPVK